MSEHIDTLADSGTRPMHGDFVHEPGAATVVLPRLALFRADAALLAHVEEALAAMHAQVVYRAPIGDVDVAALQASGAAIALINLDDCCDARLDDLAATLDGAGIPAVFNDADISRGLEGWARARWARHLAAKLGGSADVYPPRPVHAAEAGIGPASQESRTAPEGFSEPALEPQPSAARPLTQDEIESLLADFPAESEINGHDTAESEIDGHDTAELSAHVDALLANAAGSAHEPAPWEISASIDLHDAPAPAAASDAKPFAAAVAAGPESWQLIDDPQPVVSAPHESKPAAASPVTHVGGLDLELEPLEYPSPVSSRERGFEEMRFDNQAVKPAGAVK